RTWADGFTSWVLDPIRSGLTATPWWVLVLAAAVLGLLAGGWGAMATAATAMAGAGVIDVWNKSLDTLSQAIAGVVVTLVLGFLIGVLAARVPVVERVLRPVLDTMQTLPQFIYLIPVVALFNVGRSAAVAAAVLYALPAVIRITVQGLRQVDPAALEASRSLGAGTFQQIRQVQVPLARPALMLALNQGVVLVLAMVIVGGFVGSGALGYDVVYGLQKSDLGTGLTAGVAIVLLGLVLDRTTQRTRSDTGTPSPPAPLSPRRSGPAPPAARSVPTDETRRERRRHAPDEAAARRPQEHRVQRGQTAPHPRRRLRRRGPRPHRRERLRRCRHRLLVLEGLLRQG